MTIDEQHRHDLHSRLDDVLGPKEATTLMQHLPPVGWADVATRQDLDHLAVLLRSDIRVASVELRDELRGDMAELRDELRGDMAELRDELRSDMTELRDELRSDMTELRDELRSDMVGMERRLFDAFGTFRDEIHRDRRTAQRQLLFVLVVAFVSLLVATATG